MSKVPVVLAAALTIGAIALPTIAARPGDAARGETLFNQRCATCHTVVAGATKPMGPNLRGLIGRRPGAAPGYARYSAALKSQTSVWTAAQLDLYLKAPMQTVRGTTMMINVPAEQDRADLIAFLAAQR